MLSIKIVSDYFKTSLKSVLISLSIACSLLVAELCQLFATPWIVAHKAPQARILERVKPFPSSDIFFTQGSESSALQVDSLLVA